VGKDRSRALVLNASMLLLSRNGDFNGSGDGVDKLPDTVCPQLMLAIICS
jgi:hypothetical protein